MIIFLKKFLKLLIFNKINEKFSKNFINADNLKFKKLSNISYFKFLIKNLIKKNIKLKKKKFIFIYLFTLIYELSGNAWNLKYKLFINNKIKNFNLIDLVQKINYLLPTGFLITILEKKKNLP